MSQFFVPFNRPSFDNRELDLIQLAIENGHISGDGPFSKKAESILSKMHGGAPVLLTPSCSHALELAARLIGFTPGDEVIVPSFTFVTSVSSFVSQGATPVFCDINPITLGLDFEMAQDLISPRTKAIVLVHYGGIPAEPEKFQCLAENNNLILVEDNAHGLGGVSNEKALGTFGAMSTLSFHETKNVTCGEGGALVVNDAKYMERAEILREKGTDRSRHFRGEVDKYTWRDLGSSWVLSDLLAAVLYAQLQKFEEIHRRRINLYAQYRSILSHWANELGFELAKGQTTTGHLFHILVGNSENQSELITHLQKEGVRAFFHYQPLHQSPFGRKFRTGQTMQVTELTAASLVRLPLHNSMTDDEQAHVIGALASFSSQK